MSRGSSDTEGTGCGSAARGSISARDRLR